MAIADKNNNKTSSSSDMEKVLGRIILRLTLATSGLDPSLDPHLKSLRNAVRKGVGGTSIEQLSEISEQLVRAEGENSGTADRGGEIQLIERLMPFIPLKGSKATRFRVLGEKIATAAATPSENEILEFLQLLEASDKNEEKVGIFSRLFSSKSEGQDALQLNEVLRSLLEKIEWPDQMSSEVGALIGQLTPKSPVNQWEETLRKLVASLASALGTARSEIKATESFLSELDTRLSEIDRYVTRSEERRQQSQAEGEALGRDVNQHVGDIRDDMREAKSLEQLRVGIDRHLDQITASVEEFVQTEMHHHQEAATSEVRLKGELEVVENEAKELRRKVIEAHRQAATDSVTGLPNRMAYEERLSQEYARWKRFDEPLTMLVWDVDDFKKINDRFGHQSGDKALRIIAQQLQKSLRETDFVARFGGEEFTMLLAGTSLRDAVKLAESIKNNVSQSGFHSGGMKVPVTISCGVGEFTEGDTPDSVFRRADNALYEAKRAGKDRVASL